LDNHQADLQILITLRNVTGTITHKVFNTSTFRCSLYEFGEQVCTQSLLFCLVLGLSFSYSIGLSSVYNLFSSALYILFSESESYIMTNDQSVSLSWNKEPIWSLRPDFHYCQTVAGLLTWGALSDERMGQSFTIAAGPCQRSHSPVRVPWNFFVLAVVIETCLSFRVNNLYLAIVTESFCTCCLGIDVSVITSETCFNKPLPSNVFTFHHMYRVKKLTLCILPTECICAFRMVFLNIINRLVFVAES
jgi:hypothetical protein